MFTILSDKKVIVFSKAILNGRRIQRTFISWGKFRCFILGYGEAIHWDLLLIARYKFVNVVTQVARWVEEAGFFVLWRQRVSGRGIEKVLKVGGITFGPPGYRAIPLASHIQVLFYLLVIAQCGVIGVFLWELASPLVAWVFIRNRRCCKTDWN